MRFEILKSTNGGYFWRIKGGNGEIMASSQVCTAKESAKHAVSVVQANASGASVYDLT